METILIIDDDPQIIDLLTKFLEENKFRGFELRRRRNGAAIAKNHNPKRNYR